MLVPYVGILNDLENMFELKPKYSETNYSQIFLNICVYTHKVKISNYLGKCLTFSVAFNTGT